MLMKNEKYIYDNNILHKIEHRMTINYYITTGTIKLYLRKMVRKKIKLSHFSNTSKTQWKRQ